MKTPDIDTLTRQLTPVSDEQAGSAVSPATRSELAGRIMNSPMPADSRHRVATPRRLVLAAAVLTVLAGSTVIASKNWPGQDQPRALSVTDQGNAVVVRVIDPLADPKRYNKEFKQLGFDIRVRMVPVSPPWVGKLESFGVYKDGEMGRTIHMIEAGSQCAPTLDASDPACQVGVRVEKTFKGRAEINFGRATRPGEEYHHTSSSAGDPGEAMHGLSFRNRTVAEVLPMVASRDLTVDYRVGEGSTMERPETVPGEWYVHEAVSFSPGTVILYVGPERLR